MTELYKEWTIHKFATKIKKKTKKKKGETKDEDKGSKPERRWVKDQQDG